MPDSPSTETIAALLIDIKSDIKEIKDCYVTNKEFQPVRNVVYGMVAIILVAVCAAVVALVMNGGTG